MSVPPLKGSDRLVRPSANGAACTILMAIGIGGNTAVYSLINGVLNKPAPGIRAENLVNLTAMLPEDPNADIIAYPVFADFLIAVEAEMNKVSWPTRGELFRASMVVLIEIFALAIVLTAYDLFWNGLLRVLHIV